MRRSVLALVVVGFFSAAFAVDCPDGWRKFSAGDPDKCFRGFELPMQTRIDGSDFCRNQAQQAGQSNGYLTSITSAYETNFLQALTADMSQMSTDVWIGLIDKRGNGDYIWDDGTPLTYTNWEPGQPDRSLPCVTTKARGSGKWSTEECINRRSVICDLFPNLRCSSGWTAHNGFCFKRYADQNRTWSESEAFCRSQGANLASVHSAGENAFIASSVKNHAWLGLYTMDDATWFWTDNTASDYKGWCSGKPERGATKYCSHIISGGSDAGRWDNKQCTTTLPEFVCKKAGVNFRQKP